MFRYQESQVRITGCNAVAVRSSSFTSDSVDVDIRTHLFPDHCCVNVFYSCVKFSQLVLTGKLF